MLDGTSLKGGEAATLTCQYSGVSSSASISLYSNTDSRAVMTDTVSAQSVSHAFLYIASGSENGDELVCKIESITSTDTVTLTIASLIDTSKYIFATGKLPPGAAAGFKS